VKNDDWLMCFLFAHTKNTKPDGRPLYACKCGETKYEELKNLAQLKFDSSLRGGRQVDQVAAIFCFYAASTFCRKHVQGAWSWETVF